mmetsp:Transcript_5284/g.12557  ORF Transcript_5284/g.12557 Transcript_5284/m.12557 type:complete len:381 (-) Transcript_5284:52-1194(-)
MAPAKGKRGAPKSPATSPRQKKPKRDPLLSGVVDGIKQAKDLPESCRAMLAAVAPGCLTTPQSERHESQSEVTAWIGQVLEGVRAKLQEAYDAAAQAEAENDEKEEAGRKKVLDTKASLAEREKEVGEGEARLNEAKQAVAAAKSRLKERLQAETSGNARLTEAEKEKTELEKGLSESIEFLKTQEGFEVTKAQQCINALWPAAKRLGLDESLVLALPAAAEKPPSSRGPFDQMVLKQLETSVRSKVSDLVAELAAGADGRSQRAAAVAVAEGEVKAAEEAHGAADAAFSAAGEERRRAAAAAEEAESAVEQLARERGPAVEVRDAKKAALDNFTSYNVECFNMLRDRQVPAPPAEASEVAGTASEVAGAASEAASAAAE